VHDLDGGGDERPTAGQRARWNPTQRDEFVFVRRDGSDWNIWKYDSNGAMKRLIQSDADNFDPVYSPDGQYIAYTSNKSGSSDIWVMRVDGSEETQVTVHGSVDCQPAWTQDGKALLFTSNRAGSFDLFRVSVEDFVVALDGTATQESGS
jgi:Tol biopolymer transport system component